MRFACALQRPSVPISFGLFTAFLEMRRFDHAARLQVRPSAGGRLELIVADRAPLRLLGLALLESLDHEVGLLIPRCRSIHTLGMRFRIDVLFVIFAARTLMVAELHEAVAPRHVVRSARSGVSAVELTAGEARRLRLRCGVTLLVR